MPRTATNRNFGFRSPGLVRILTSANPDEVLTALEILGISPERPETMEQALQNVVMVGVEHVAGWVGALQDLGDVVTGVSDIVALFSISEYELSTTEQIAQLQSRLREKSNRIRAIAIASMNQFEGMRENFIASMLRAKVQNPEVTWPEMPGIDSQL